MKNTALIILLFSGLSTLLGQNESTTDSLKQLLRTTEDVEVSVTLHENLFEAYLYSNLDSADAYRSKIKSLSKAHDYTNGLYLFHSLSGRYHFAKSDLDSAFAHIESASKIAQQLQNKAYLADCYKKIGVIYNIGSNDSLSQKYGLMALENAAQTDDWRLISSIYILLGNRSFQRAEYPEALTYYLKLDSIYTAQNDLDKSLAAAYTNIGMIYSELKNPAAAEYIKKSIEVYRTLGLKEGVSYGQVALGTYYDLLGENQKAIEHLLLAKDYYEEYGDLRTLGNIYDRLGGTYLEMNDFENAEFYLLKVSTIPENRLQMISAATNQMNLGDLYRYKKQYQKSIHHHNKALEIIEKESGVESMATQKLNVYRGLYDTYKDSKDYENAVVMLEKQMALKDSIQKSQNLTVVEELNQRYQNEKQRQEIVLLTTEAQLTEQKASNQRNIFIAGISILTLALITLFILFRNKQKTNQRLKQLEAAKSKFFANISHEFRTPLTLISGPVAHQLSREGLSTDDKTDLGLIQRNANRLLKYINQILDLSKIEAGSRRLRVSQGNMALFLKHLIEPFQYQAAKKGAVLEDTIRIDGHVWFDRDVVEKIVANLLSNALKYNQNNSPIKFMAIQQDLQIVMATTNQNNNLKEKELPQLFDRFYQNNSIHQGFGIGLSLVHELTALSRGKVRAYKPDSETIVFEVTLPITKSAFSKKDLILEDERSEINEPENATVFFESNPIEEELEENTLPVLLVVDDNAEIRLFIKSLFKKEYQILEAENGEQGTEIALKTIPDLIISDVMMPVQDGIYMSNTLKSDERTSHVPIILLTAKSGEENELKGLKTGADAYMVKPFKEEKLRVVIEKLIATRTAIQQKFNTQPFIKPKGIKLTNVDTRLMERIRQILDVEVTNPEFNVSSFSEQVGLSRMHLHRKLKALTGLSTSEFIRTQRLKLAAQLLMEGHTNVSEIGYSVGFNQPAYFATAFKQQFGCPPSEYALMKSKVG